MADDGAVVRDVVLAVLKASGVDVAIDDGRVKLAKGADPKSTLRVLLLPELINRRTLHFLARSYAVPIHHFYNPQMVLNPPAAGNVVTFPASVVAAAEAKTGTTKT